MPRSRAPARSALRWASLLAAWLLGCGAPGGGARDASSDASADAFVPCNPACGGDTPACDTARGVCVACAVDTDCSPPQGVCDPGSHQCVTCLAGADCASGVCNPDHSCCLAVGCAGLTCGDWDDGCGNTVHCGSCARGSYCMAGACMALPPTYPCGSQSCARGSEFCLATFDSASQTTTRKCVALPAACAASPSCACLTANLQSAVSSSDWRNYCSLASPPVTCVEESADHPEYQGAWFLGCG